MDVQSFGARGDGKSDDTAAIQAAVDAGTANRQPIFFSPTAAGYRMNRVTIRGPLTLDLGGSRILLAGRKAGFLLAGSVPDFTIRNGEISGDGQLSSQQVAVLTSGVVDQTSTYDRFVASDLVLKNCMSGLQVVSPRNGRIERVHVVSTVGVYSGTGYGISFAGLDCQNMIVADCTFTRTTRHGLYVAGARNNVQLHNLAWYDHAPGQSVATGRSALAISRSQNVIGTQLHFYACADECIGIDDDDGGHTLQDVSLSNIVIRDPRAVALRIGVATPWIDGQTEVSRVLIDGLDLTWTGSPSTYPIVIQEAKDVTIRNITVS
jgi:polygalacturonase